MRLSAVHCVDEDDFDNWPILSARKLVEETHLSGDIISFHECNWMLRSVWCVTSNSYFHILNNITHIFRAFWVNIVISKLNLLYRYCLKLIRELRKEKEFRQQCCWNLTKIRREKEEEFRQHYYRNSSVQISVRPVSCVKKSNYDNVIVEIEKKKKILGNCGNDIVENGKKKFE